MVCLLVAGAVAAVAPMLPWNLRVIGMVVGGAATVATVSLGIARRVMGWTADGPAAALIISTLVIWVAFLAVQDQTSADRTATVPVQATIDQCDDSGVVEGVPATCEYHWTYRGTAYSEKVSNISVHGTRTTIMIDPDDPRDADPDPGENDATIRLLFYGVGGAAELGLLGYWVLSEVEEGGRRRT